MPFAASAASAPAVDVRAEEGILHIKATIDVPNTQGEAWGVVRNYDHLAEYMPNVDSSRVISRTDSSVIVRQVVTSRLVLPWTFRFTLEMIQATPQRLCFSQLEGNLRSYEGCWQMEPREKGVRIGYWAKVGYGFRLPAFIIAFIARHQFRKMMPALAAELKRRHSPPSFQ